MNNGISEHLRENWAKYLAVLAAAILLWGVVFDSLAKPKYNEQVVISFFGDEIDIKGINERLYASRESFTSQPLKNIYISYEQNDIADLNQILMARMETSDIIIFTEDMLVDKDGGNARVALYAHFRFLGAGDKPELLKNIIGERADSLEYFYDTDINGVKRPIGIYLNGFDGAEGKNIFESHYNGKHRCVAVFCQKSVNIGKMFDGGDGTDTAAIDALLYLLGGD